MDTNDYSAMNDDLDSDDDEELPQLADRLENVNLDDSEEVWKALGNDEKQRFASLVQTGEITNFLPVWVPWWENKKQNKPVRDVSEEGQQDYKHQCPNLLSTIRPFAEISVSIKYTPISGFFLQSFRWLQKSKPAECVRYNLLNVMAAYACIARYFNGDHFELCHEAAYLLMNISLNLNSNTNFESFTSALNSVHHMCLSVSIIFYYDDLSKLKSSLNFIGYFAFFIY